MDFFFYNYNNINKMSKMTNTLGTIGLGLYGTLMSGLIIAILYGVTNGVKKLQIRTSSSSNQIVKGGSRKRKKNSKQKTRKY
jgi:hypothetical protein